jgi:hypothetical protein
MKFLVAAALALPGAAATVVKQHRSLRVDKLNSSVGGNGYVDMIPGWDGPKLKELPCGQTMVVTSQDTKDVQCNSACPYIVQDKTDDAHCSFQCVPANMCSSMNPKTPIADTLEEGQMVCRSPMVQFCKEYAMDGTDTCTKCNSAYSLGADGQCHYSYMWVIYGVAGLLFLVWLFVCFWIADLKARPALNHAGIEAALAFRSRSKLHYTNEEGARVLFPMDTNLCRTQVAGPGMLLHFNFQVMVIVWALGIAGVWIAMGNFIDGDLFLLGRRRFGTPRENCILVQWGYETQQRLMWTKIYFLVFAYLFTFIGTILHSVRQLRIFQIMDADTKTMKDYVALVEGLPEIPGTENPEDEIKNILEKKCPDCSIIGVSIAWEYYEQQELVDGILEWDIDQGEKQHLGEASARAYEDQKKEFPFHRKQLYALESAIFDGEEFDESQCEEAKVKKMVEEMSSTDCAFVVFNTEHDRDICTEKLEEEGFSYRGNQCTIRTIINEPDTIKWQNFGHTGAEQMGRLFKGFGAIFLALCTWTIVFYLPYAYSIVGFNYDNGQQPGPIYSIAFTMVVVIGNAIMYEVCAEVADGVGLRYQDNREALYMILYTVACMFNVLLDFVTTYYMALMICSELGFRTYHGVKIRDIDQFTVQFETYALQRMLAENTFAYCFPGTFLVPFVLEPVITIIAPLKLAEWVVRSHPEIIGHQADMLLCSFPMDLGRYADILLNVFLGCLIFYFPGGKTHILFLGMVISHVWIYGFDHCKVLRAIPQCNYASMDVDWWSQAMCAPVAAMILSCLVFKANCQDYGYCVRSNDILIYCTAAFVAHLVLHLLCLQYLVPLMGKVMPEDHFENVEYKETASKIACSWFNANPIHCLRSQFLHKHEPHCRFCFMGKEHQLHENPKIHCYFKASAAEVEDYGTKGFEANVKAVQTVNKAKNSLLKLIKSKDKSKLEGLVSDAKKATGSASSSK